MASHSIPFRKTVSGRDFAEVEFFDRVRCRTVRRCMIDGKPIPRAKWEAELAAELKRHDATLVVEAA